MRASDCLACFTADIVTDWGLLDELGSRPPPGWRLRAAGRTLAFSEIWCRHFKSLHWAAHI